MRHLFSIAVSELAIEVWKRVDDGWAEPNLLGITCHSQSSQVTLTYSDTVDRICVQFLLVVELVCTDSSIGGGDGLMVLSDTDTECVWSSSSILGGEMVLVVLVCTGKS